MTKLASIGKTTSRICSENQLWYIQRYRNKMSFTGDIINKRIYNRKVEFDVDETKCFNFSHVHTEVLVEEINFQMNSLSISSRKHKNIRLRYMCCSHYFNK